MGRTRANTQPATDAPIQIQDRFLIVYRKGFHLTALDTSSTTFACFGIEAGHKRTGNKTGRIRIAFNTAEHAAATAATGSDKRGFLSVGWLEDKSDFLGTLEDRQGFLHVDGAAPASAHHDSSCHSKAQAALLGLLATFTHYAHLLPADAIGHGKCLMGPHQFLRPLVEHYLSLRADALPYRDRS